MGLYNHRLMTTGTLWERALGCVEYLKFCRYEGTLARSTAASVFCSRVDLDFVRQHAPDANLVQVVNGVDCNVFSPMRADDKHPGEIFFSGNFHYAPNRSAVRYLLTQILPRVFDRVPSASLAIVGNGAREFMASMGSPMP
jgi:hypothetical protein